jgi:hypothetical protein
MAHYNSSTCRESKQRSQPLFLAKTFCDGGLRQSPKSGEISCKFVSKTRDFRSKTAQN